MATGTTVDVVMPQMGVSVSEGTISQWLTAEGDTIEKDETLLEISTDKVDTEVPSPATGVVTKIVAPEGETLDVGALLAVIEVGGEGGGSAAPAEPTPADEPAQQVLEAEVPAAPAAPATATPPSEPAPAQTPAAPAAPAAASSNGVASPGRFVSPVVARIAAEHGIDPSTVPGTGSGGRVTKKDILGFIQGGSAPAGAAPAQQQPQAATTPAPAAAPAPAPSAPAAAPASSRRSSRPRARRSMSVRCSR